MSPCGHQEAFQVIPSGDAKWYCRRCDEPWNHDEHTWLESAVWFARTGEPGYRFDVRTPSGEITLERFRAALCLTFQHRRHDIGIDDHGLPLKLGANWEFAISYAVSELLRVNDEG